MLLDNELKDFFKSGFYKNFWGWKFDEKESRRIAEKSIELLGVSTGHILDWCGGWGRISLFLAKKGFTITILDFIKEYLDKAKNIFKKNNLDVTTVNADCRNTPFDIQADHAICIFNSIGFLPDNEQVLAFQSLFKAIRAGGRVIIDSINQLFIAKFFLPLIENTRPDGIKCIQKNDFDLYNSILSSHFLLIDTNGTVLKEKFFKQRIYTPLELKNLLEKSGFKVLNMYGDFDKQKVSFDLPQIITLVQK